MVGSEECDHGALGDDSCDSSCMQRGRLTPGAIAAIAIGTLFCFALICAICATALFWSRRQPQAVSQLVDLPLVEDIVLQEKIGQGKFGCVWRGIWNGTNVALKQVKSHVKFSEEQFNNEVQVLLYIVTVSYPRFLFLFIFSTEN